MQRVDDLEPGEGTQFLLHPLVALSESDLLDEWVGDRVQPRGRDPHSSPLRRLPNLAPDRWKVSDQLRYVGEHGGAHLHAILEELGGQPLKTARSGFEHGRYGRGQLPGGRIHELELFYHAYGVRRSLTEAVFHTGVAVPAEAQLLGGS